MSWQECPGENVLEKMSWHQEQRLPPWGDMLRQITAMVFFGSFGEPSPYNRRLPRQFISSSYRFHTKVIGIVAEN